MFTLGILLAKLMIVISAPVDLFRVGLAACGYRPFVGFKELLAACHFFICGRIDDEKLFNVRGVS